MQERARRAEYPIGRPGALKSLAHAFHLLLWRIKALGCLWLWLVETGGDPGHERARQTYEKVGFELFPVARYFKKL
jgi:hypothetical protein